MGLPARGPVCCLGGALNAQKNIFWAQPQTPHLLTLVQWHAITHVPRAWAQGLQWGVGDKSTFAGGGEGGGVKSKFAGVRRWGVNLHLPGLGKVGILGYRAVEVIHTIAILAVRAGYYKQKHTDYQSILSTAWCRPPASTLTSRTSGPTVRSRASLSSSSFTFISRPEEAHPNPLHTSTYKAILGKLILQKELSCFLPFFVQLSIAHGS